MRGCGTFSRMWRTGYLATALLLCGFACAASAATHRVISLPLHGTIGLAGSHVLCGSGAYKGLAYIDCGIGGPDGSPKRGGYVALMTARGKVSVLDVSKNAIVFDQVAAPLSRSIEAVTPITVHAGDEVRLAGVSTIDCKVSLVTITTTIVCFYVDKQGVRPGSFSFGVNDTTVTTLGWNAARRSRLLHGWNENG
jgi:hypothetical protein